MTWSKPYQDQELEAMLKLVNELKDGTITWLQKVHPEL
jgi:hypothetical protein